MANRIQRWMAKGLFGIDWLSGDTSGWESTQDWIRGLDLLKPGDPLQRPYEQVGPYQRVVSVIARDAASVPWEMFAVDSQGEAGDDPIPNHPIIQLFSRPNDYMLGNQLFIGSYICKLVFGEWIWYYPDLTVGRRGGLRATEGNSGGISLLNPMAVRRKMEGGAMVYSYLDPKTGTEEPLDADRLTRSARYNPYNPLRGLPLSASIMADLAGYYAAADWNKRFFGDQNGVPTLVIKPTIGVNVPPEQRDDFVRRWNSRHQKRGVGMLPGGWDIQDLGISQRDMDFSELRQFGRDEILANAGVPPLIAAYLTRPITYNAAEQKELYWESTISNFVHEERAVLNEDFLQKVGVADRLYPNWDVVKALLENLTEKTTVAKEWFSMGLSKRVINERLEMGWDEELIEDYDIGYLPFSMAPVDTLDMPRSPAGPLPPPSGEEDEPEERGLKGLSDEGREQRRTLVWKQIMIRTRDLETRFDRVIRRLMNQIREEALDYVNGLKGWLDRQGVTKQDGPDIFDVEAFQLLLQELTEPIHRQAVIRGGESVIADLGLGISFDIQDPRVLGKLAELTGKITRIVPTIEELLRESLVEGLRDGESPQQLAARVRDVMDVNLSRSMTIARTETGFAFNTGRNEGMKQAGIDRHEWLSSRDPKVRDTHRAEDGQVTTIGEPFPNTKLLYPNDPAGPPGEIINCRCVAVPVLEGETP